MSICDQINADPRDNINNYGVINKRYLLTLRKKIADAKNCSVSEIGLDADANNKIVSFPGRWVRLAQHSVRGGEVHFTSFFARLDHRRRLEIQ